MEFASIFSQLGSQVTVIEFMKQILPPFDSDIAKRLKQTLGKKESKSSQAQPLRRFARMSSMRLR